MTRDALKQLEESKKVESLATLEKVTGKLEWILARKPDLAFVPVAVTTTVYDVFANGKRYVRSRWNSTHSSVFRWCYYHVISHILQS